GSIVLDLILPNIDAIPVLQRLRGLASQSPAVVLRVKKTLAVRVIRLDFKAADHLVKSFALGKLSVHV
ncbi:MAG: DNA-binding response regulator, partial [Planctomycetes bacterium]|nr:DNA-binding response regulator [Planctomycetota bacterium]